MQLIQCEDYTLPLMGKSFIRRLANGFVECRAKTI